MPNSFHKLDVNVEPEQVQVELEHNVKANSLKDLEAEFANEFLLSHSNGDHVTKTVSGGKVRPGVNLDFDLGYTHSSSMSNADITQESGNTFKALNFNSFETNTAVYRAVKLDPTTHGIKLSHHLSEESVVRGKSGLNMKTGNHTSILGSMGLDGMGLIRANTCAGSYNNDAFRLQSETHKTNRKNYHSKEAPSSSVSTTGGLFTAEKEAKAQSLLWKFTEYPVSKNHGFSSSEIVDLQQKIKDTCLACDIEFTQESGDLVYLCQLVRNSYIVKFRIIISCLQEKCQKVVGHKYVVELFKDDCVCPLLWQKTTDDVFKGLSSVVHTTETKKRKFNSNLDFLTSPVKEEEVKVTKERNQCLLSSFLDFVKPRPVGITQVKLAESYANLSHSLKKENGESEGDNTNNDDSSLVNIEPIRKGDIEKIVDVLYLGDNDLSRSACTIIGNIARVGWLDETTDQERELLFKSLVRVVNIVARNPFSIQLQQEAVKAIHLLQPYFKPKGFTNEMAQIMLNRCAKSENTILSDYAKQAIEAFNI